MQYKQDADNFIQEQMKLKEQQLIEVMEAKFQ